MSTSFKQFKFCQVCRINHTKGRNHLYSKKHQERLNNILSSSLRKIKECQKSMEQPCIHDRLWGAEETFWCYFCAAQIDKHKQLVTVAIQQGSMIQHFASSGHHMKTSEFWQTNRLNQSELVKYVFSEADQKMFDVRCEQAVKKYEEKWKSLRLKEAEKIQRQHHERYCLLQNSSNQNGEDRIKRWYSKGSTNQIAESTWHQGAARMPGKTGGVKTVSAQGQGLTCIAIKDDGGNEGNIFTGATPPWQRDDSPARNEVGSTIGPTAEDFEKHLAREKKQKLPSSRVGANFDGRLDCGITWLPSFGRVWNKNRRNDSQKYFKKNMWHGAVMTTDKGTTERPLVVYKRKREPQETLTADDSRSIIDTVTATSSWVSTSSIHQDEAREQNCGPALPPGGILRNQYPNHFQMESDSACSQSVNPYNIQLQRMNSNSKSQRNWSYQPGFVANATRHNQDFEFRSESSILRRNYDHQVNASDTGETSSGHQRHNSVKTNDSGYKKKSRNAMNSSTPEARIQIPGHLL